MSEHKWVSERQPSLCLLINSYFSYLFISTEFLQLFLGVLAYLLTTHITLIGKAVTLVLIKSNFGLYAFFRLCNVVLCCVMLCYVMLWYDMKCYAMLYYFMLYHIILYYIKKFNIFLKKSIKNFFLIKKLKKSNFFALMK